MLLLLLLRILELFRLVLLLLLLLLLILAHHGAYWFGALRIHGRRMLDVRWTLRVPGLIKALAKAVAIRTK